jgi:competence protein ComEA
MRRLVVSSALLLAALTAAPPRPSAQAPAAPKPAASESAPINLNTATAAQLEALPGVGPAMAQRILEYRQKIGGFKKAEELMNVRGIGERAFLKLKSLVTVPAARQDRTPATPGQ